MCLYATKGHRTASLGKPRSYRTRNIQAKNEPGPALSPSRLQAIDGNSSLRRVANSGCADARSLDSTYLIPEEEVALFKNDVRDKPGATSTTASGSITFTAGALHDEDSAIKSCTDNWTAAKATNEGTTSVFDQTGVFVALCRHGILEWFTEMRRSGELAKYALAISNRIVDTYGQGQAIGYDIGCTYKVTLRNSSIGAKVEKLEAQCAVNKFHVHAHNRPCQIQHNPLYLEGFGLEDLETCERFFSSSNAIAPLVRHASYFHWIQFIDLHFDQSDRDKYQELSRFLFNNYKQSLTLIAELEPVISAFKASENIGDETFKVWLREELTYLQRLKKDPEYDADKLAYVEALEELSRTQILYDTAASKLSSTLAMNSTHFQPGCPVPKPSQPTRSLKLQHTQAHRRLQLAMQVADRAEVSIGVEKRWSPTHPEYMKVLDFIRAKKFLRTMDELERLIVQRLFELSKSHLAGTGYKLRMHISKAITRRSAAIRTALEKYNKLARQQNPPRPIFKYTEVVSAAWLGEFDLLRSSRHNLLSEKWAQGANREMTTKYFQLIRAKEELHRVHVEMVRLHQWVDEEDQQTRQVIENTEDPLLAGVVRAYYLERHRVNDIHRTRLRAIQELEGYRGPKLGSSGTNATSRKDEGLDGEQLQADEDDEVADETTRLQEYLERIPS